MNSVTKPTLVLMDSVQTDVPVSLKYEELETIGYNTVSYNIRLLDEYGNDASLPGESILCLPYPDGINKDNVNTYRITICHYGTGNTEVFNLNDGSIEPTEQGLCIRISSLSPFDITWEQIPDNINLPKTGDNSQIGLWLALLTVAGAAMLTLKRKTA